MSVLSQLTYFEISEPIVWEVIFNYVDGNFKSTCFKDNQAYSTFTFGIYFKIRDYYDSLIDKGETEKVAFWLACNHIIKSKPQPNKMES